MTPVCNPSSNVYFCRLEGQVTVQVSLDSRDEVNDGEKCEGKREERERLQETIIRF